jgi:alpha-beta hydrolase superfamily lysophospholipase
MVTVALMASLGTAQGSAAAGPGSECDQVCRWLLDQQQQNALERTSFYDAPRPLKDAPGGTLIRQEQTAEYRVDGVPTSATRILYHSRTSDGRDVAASGVVLVPRGTPPETGWPVVVDAHGASGIARDCAPSLMRDLYHGDQMMKFVEKGWAVVAPDYAGMGTDGRPEFLNKTAESSDLIHGLAAARQAIPSLSSRWVVWGHSQGGGAALAVAERQRTDPQRGYLGAVVTSPAADLTPIVHRLADVEGLGGFLPLVVRGASFSDPAIETRRILSIEAASRLPVTAFGCLGVVGAVYADLAGDDLVRPGMLEEDRLARYLAANSTGRTAVGGPVLLLQGEADSVVPEALTAQVAADLCRSGARLTYRTYPGLEHDTYPGQTTGIDDGAMPDILAWTAERFAGLPASTTC